MSASRTTILLFLAIALLLASIATVGITMPAMGSQHLAQQNVGAPNNPPSSPHCGIPANTWHLSGNRNSDPNVDFLGTGDAADLVIATNCSERLRVLATGETIVHHDLHVGEDLSVDGTTSLNDLEVSNDLAIQGNLSVLGHTSLTTLNASDDATFEQDLMVNGLTTLDALDVLDTAVLLSDLVVHGQSSFNDFASFAGATSFSGPATFTSNATFGANATVAGDLDIGGTTRTGVLEILGADLAEEFPFSEPVQPGMVVAIDPDNAGQLQPARGAYNRRVAGIVAGANEFSTGLVLGRGSGNEFAAPVALSGRVYVFVDTTEHGVEVGDLLTTSDRAGYAMAVRDYSQMHGAVIGKAMTPLAQGETGLVLVLVNLQ